MGDGRLRSVLVYRFIPDRPGNVSKIANPLVPHCDMAEPEKKEDDGKAKDEDVSQAPYAWSARVEVCSVGGKDR